MTISISNIDGDFHFRAQNEEGIVVNMDGSPAIGGHNQGMRPMQLLLSSLGGCTGIDVVMILKKQKQEFNSFNIKVNGDREQGQDASVFEKIHIEFSMRGDVDGDKLKRAVQLSMDKYCSVAKTLEKTAKIDYSIILNDQTL
jgi:putative redox protein